MYVCFPYEFTLLSNCVYCENISLYCLFPLRIYTALKLAVESKGISTCLFPLRIYTALKQNGKDNKSYNCLFPLRIYTALKPVSYANFTYLSLFPLRIYTALKPWQTDEQRNATFVSPTNLHCSQTCDIVHCIQCRLFPLRIYTALKRECTHIFRCLCLFPLRIYTALKPQIVQE